MVNDEYDITTEWYFNAPLRDVWKIIFNFTQWPDWWIDVQSTQLTRFVPGNGNGSSILVEYKNVGLKTLKLEITVLKLDVFRTIRGRISGDLAGKAVWTFIQDKENTRVTFRMRVKPTKKWIQILNPVLKPLYVYNHKRIMQNGYEGIIKRLNV